MKKNLLLTIFILLTVSIMPLFSQPSDIRTPHVEIIQKPRNGGVDTTATIAVLSDNSDVIQAYRWRNVGCQRLLNEATGQYETFDEHLALLPSQTKFWRKSVTLKFAVKTTFDTTYKETYAGTTPNRASRATCRVDGTIMDTAAGIYPSLSDSSTKMMGGKEVDGEWVYVVDDLVAYDETTIRVSDYIYFYLNAKGEGDIQLTSGGGMETGVEVGGKKLKMQVGVEGAVYVGGAPQSNVSTTHYDSAQDERQVNVVEDRPDQHKCDVPDVGLYGTARVPLCPADSDAGLSYTLPSSLYHWYPCPEGHCNHTSRWICYNSPCGHPWWWNIFHDEYYLY